MSEFGPAGRRSFLGVDRSVSGRRWDERLDAAASLAATAMVQRHELPELLARVLAARGVTVDAAAEFLEPSLRRLMPDPSTLTDMDAAAARIADAVERGEQVAIFGDYDVDGATSSALLARFLAAQGLTPRIYIPDRIFEGYGPNPDAIRTLIDEGAELIVTVDCGSTSHEALGVAASLGRPAVVLDHHQMGAELPPAVAVVNPNRQDDLSGLGYLAAVGVTFLAIVAVNRELRRRGWYAGARTEPDLLQWLDLVALGTVCDVVPLVGLNRAFVVKGLIALRRGANSGIAALGRLARIDAPLSPYHLGFLIGPRINAGGRIGDAALGARLLSLDEAAQTEVIAAELDELNRQRQAVEAAMLEQALAEADAEIGGGEGPAVIVTADPQWHPGIVGLIAARLKERFQRPAFAIAIAPNGLGTGSGRSVPGVDLGSLVRAAVAEGLLVKGGGHAMAAGITIERTKLGDFRAFLEERAGEASRTARAVTSLAVDGALTARAATPDFIEAIERAGPFGAGHPEPVFAFPSHRIAYAEPVGNGHVRVSLSGGDQTLRGIAFRAAGTELGRMLTESRGRALHVAGTLGIDHWQGRRQPSLRILDVAEPPLPR
ncbi:single-stranded-DNA-specific exonuclease RecJ [Kaistia geumhonensis]|uniref:Single-stranded-DNA-specific exonuclease RecJ n=1 Tax=Kaistia geumhonensis TaxID=410839 RepID=A0ABU0M229_9HYPH|nr:single-stranded-DNA-specific exonuclease RecJ [Kaistia geumhonensis]MCX5479869.1 single-stranded-DNA-specific exonuclease RecJ [Kaistia geumhonensis]MDQ0514905.1 single-stranded-DNA-specific exonuclease [Kaistia geumhonensis]